MTERGTNGHSDGAEDSSSTTPHLDLRGYSVEAKPDRSRRHVKCATLLGPYLLAAVDAEEAAEVETHLSECPSCEALLEALAAGLVAMLPDAGTAVLERIWARINTAIS